MTSIRVLSPWLFLPRALNRSHIALRFFSTVSPDTAPTPLGARSQHPCEVTETLKSFLNCDFIPWTKVKKCLVDSSKVHQNKINGSILRTCIKEGWTNIGLSFYKYTESSGEKLSLGELSLVLKLFSLELDVVLKNKKTVMKLFEYFKPHLETQELLHNDFAKVFSQFPKTWKVLADICETSNFISPNWVVAGAFNFNKPNIGWKLWRKNPESFSDASAEAYFNYCIRLAEKRKFSENLINDVVDFCEESVKNFSNLNLFDQCKTLTDVLNSDPNEKFKWSVDKTVIERNNCLSCGLKLKSVKITREEIKKLKSHILKDGLISLNVNIRTSKREITNFITFLDNCSPYDIVIDGLNVLHQSIEKPFYDIIETFKKNNKKILFIGKKHLKDHKYFYYLKNNCQIFLTENRSDDDLFVIYATLNGGENTFFATADYLRGYADLIQCPHMQKVFLKWKFSHQYQVIKKFKGSYTLLPKIHANLPQKIELSKSNSIEKEHCWHLPVLFDVKLSTKISKESYWLCLKAVQRK